MCTMSYGVIEMQFISLRYQSFYGSTWLKFDVTQEHLVQDSYIRFQQSLLITVCDTWKDPFMIFRKPIYVIDQCG